MATVRSTVPPAPAVVSTFWTWVALLLALIGVAGSLYMSIGFLNLGFGLNLVPCPLCFYQRTLLMAVAGVLLVGLFGGPARSGFLSLVTMPLTLAALGIAGLQIYWEIDEIIECPDGVITQTYKEFQGADDLYKQMHGLVTPPKESAALLFLLFVAQFIDVARSASRGGFGLGGFLGAIIVGGLLCAGALLTYGHGNDIRKAGDMNGCRPIPGK